MSRPSSLTEYPDLKRDRLQSERVEMPTKSGKRKGSRRDLDRRAQVMIAELEEYAEYLEEIIEELHEKLEESYELILRNVDAFPTNQ